jgi:hypothetical protein
MRTHASQRIHFVFRNMFLFFCFAKVADVKNLAWNDLKKLVIVFRTNHRLERWPLRFRIRLFSSTHVLNCCCSISVLVILAHLCCIIVQFGFARHTQEGSRLFFVVVGKSWVLSTYYYFVISKSMCVTITSRWFPILRFMHDPQICCICLWLKFSPYFSLKVVQRDFVTRSFAAHIPHAHTR